MWRMLALIELNVENSNILTDYQASAIVVAPTYIAEKHFLFLLVKS
jgi:hypothetical protein